MKKMVILVCVVMLLAGCTRVESDSTDYKQLISVCLTDKVITNNVGLGYKFYVPRGVKLINNYDYNQKFLIDDVYVYLYVDIISYYYKNYDKGSSSGSYYYQDFGSGDKLGYIRIESSKNNMYYVSMVYNYAKIEFYVSKNKLSKFVSLSAIILNNIKYNDLIVKNILENSSGGGSNVTYEVDKPEDAGSNFSQFLEEFIQEDTEEDKSEGLPSE